MQISFLPNSFKKVGIVFVIASFITGYQDIVRGFQRGYTSQPYDVPMRAVSLTSLESWSDILLFVGMLIYVFSKEKIEDEYLFQKRAESFTLSFVGILLVSFMLFLAGITVTKILWLLFVQLASFLIIFYFKKREVA
jgi:hypothetical protein